jgi:hypothetical protein
MHGMLLAGLLLLAIVAVAPAADAQPPSGGYCDVKEEYVTHASVGTDPNGVPTVKPGSVHPIECYY